MGAVVGVVTEEMIELDMAVGQALLPIELRHRQLVLVGAEDSTEHILILHGSHDGSRAGLYRVGSCGAPPSH